LCGLQAETIKYGIPRIGLSIRRIVKTTELQKSTVQKTLSDFRDGKVDREGFYAKGRR
jgi:hypothetical protein